MYKAALLQTSQTSLGGHRHLHVLCRNFDCLIKNCYIAGMQVWPLQSIMLECGTVASSQHLQAINIKHWEVRDPITLPSLALKTCLWQVCGRQNLTFKSFCSPQFYLLACWNLQGAYWKDNTSVTRSWRVTEWAWRGSQAAWQNLTQVIRTVLEYWAARPYKPAISERWMALKRADETLKGKNSNKDGSLVTLKNVLGRKAGKAWEHKE